jgi:hypothetical protein
MDRTEIEVKLNRDRAWLLETYAALSPEELARGVTPSEHDPSSVWSPKDHLVHLAGIERNFNAMVRRHLDGDANPVDLATAADGTARAREEVMAHVHRLNEDWVLEHGAASLGEIISLGLAIRAETLSIVASLNDAQLAEKLPGAPWADGTIGGVLAVNADHGRMHWRWVKEGFERVRGG